MNVIDLGKKYADEAAARRASEVANDTERFTKTIDDWSHYNEFGSHKHKLYSEWNFVYKREPYCLYIHTKETDPVAIEKITVEYTTRGFKCQLSRDGMRFMISSEHIRDRILSAGYSGDRDIYIPDIEDTSREFYDKHRGLLTVFKGQFGSGPTANMHRQLWEISSKINEMGMIIVENKDNSGRIQDNIDYKMSEVNPICRAFCRSVSTLSDRAPHVRPAQESTSFAFWPMFDYLWSFGRARI